jgi:hypothetical protein
MTSSKPTTWRKSSYSAANGNCVEVATAQQVVCVRDTTQPATGPVLEFPAAAWISFIAAV